MPGRVPGWAMEDELIDHPMTWESYWELQIYGVLGANALALLCGFAGLIRLWWVDAHANDEPEQKPQPGKTLGL